MVAAQVTSKAKNAAPPAGALSSLEGPADTPHPLCVPGTPSLGSQSPLVATERWPSVVQLCRVP